MSRWNRPVSFNRDCPFDQKLLKHIEKYPCYSKFIKQLIKDSMEGSPSIPQQSIQPIPQKPAIKSELIQSIL